MPLPYIQRAAMHFSSPHPKFRQGCWTHTREHFVLRWTDGLVWNRLGLQLRLVSNSQKDLQEL